MPLACTQENHTHTFYVLIFFSKQKNKDGWEEEREDIEIYLKTRIQVIWQGSTAIYLTIVLLK